MLNVYTLGAPGGPVEHAAPDIFVDTTFKFFSNAWRLPLTYAVYSYVEYANSLGQYAWGYRFYFTRVDWELESQTWQGLVDSTDMSYHNFKAMKGMLPFDTGNGLPGMFGTMYHLCDFGGANSQMTQFLDMVTGYPECDLEADFFLIDIEWYLGVPLKVQQKEEAWTFVYNGINDVGTTYNEGENFFLPVSAFGLVLDFTADEAILTKIAEAYKILGIPHMLCFLLGFLGTIFLGAGVASAWFAYTSMGDN